MRLDLNRIAELESEIATLKAQENAIYEASRDLDFNSWYPIHKDELHEINEKIDRDKSIVYSIIASNIDVGDGISLSPWTDVYAFTVIERKDTPKGLTLKIQRDRAIRTDDNGMSDCQGYRFERDPNGRIEIVRWNPKKGWFTCDCYRVIMGRHEYYDYSF